MKPVNKAELLRNLEDRVEEHISEAIALFQNLSNADLNKPSPTGGWSIAQCLDHLNSYGDFYLPHIEKNLLHAADGNTSEFKSSWFGAYFTNMMDPETGKKKYKAMTGHIPASDLNGPKVVGEFLRQQEALMDYIRKARNKDLGEINIPISISKLIRLRLGDVFQFLIAHNERHMQQAKRNLMGAKAAKIG
ncbi:MULTISPECIES: DinB family protein [Dyadobacter]|uniref:DinB family protein n=1 Tax=Dyadobacter chenhuakuii TaxID=2909339 RepID=A0ABY4XQV5_9BACT|nr:MULTISPECIES: DinB family protein [Dyadobacter]MCF2493350.1 DinB family protein [Dyadobacter chenhuakuii]MCF2517265.1 DinB family protein [Dyadobacter sp. CY351]USJ32372.1 DinB family protein [Dyadobacter chenhuakuii]